MSVDSVDDWPDEIEFKNFDLTRLRRILRKEGSYYPIVAGCDNPYRDGYVTEPPKKPRASYLFFQATLRSYFAKKHPSAVQAELMGMLGEAWRSMDEIEKKPFQILADEESKQYDKERVLLEKAQKPNGVWQPLRRCRQVLDRLAGDSFAEIFLEPVDTKEFPDYEEHIDVPMDLGTVRERIENRKYIAPEQFARDMRRVRIIPCHSVDNILWNSHLFTPLLRFGTTVRFIISTALLFGMLLTTCQNNSKDCITRGFWSFASVIFVGQTLELDLGNTLAAFTTENVEPKTTRWCYAITAMQCMAFNA
jgi:hypothetical protein